MFTYYISLYTTYEGDHSIPVSLLLTNLNQHDTVQIHLCSYNQESIFGHLDCFQSRVTVNIAAINVGVLIFFLKGVFGT